MVGERLPRFTVRAIFTAMVNKAVTVEMAGPFDADAARIVRALRNAAVHVTAETHHGPDFVIRFADREQPIVVEAKRHLNVAAARQLAYTTVGQKLPLIVIAADATADARELLENSGIGLIDGGGYAHVELPGLLLHVADPGLRATRQAGPARPTRLTGKAGVVAQAILLDRHRAWGVQDLADTAGVSPALAHRVLARLDAEHLTTTIGAGPHRTRTITDPAALLDLWAEEMTDRHVQRHQLYRLARSPDEVLTKAGAGLRRADIGHAATGAAVAARMAPFITAVPVTEIWIAAITDPTLAAAAIDAELVPTGHNLVLLQAQDDTPLAFHRDQDGLTVVNPYRLYYDLRRDPRRGREQADRLRQEILQP